jgi:hypothetical protein
MNEIKSIDFTKGISIFCILFINTLNYWLIIEGELKYIIAYVVIFSEIFGAMLFIFTYSFETIFILQKMMGSPPEKKYRNIVLKRGFTFIILGILYNVIISLLNDLNPLLWGWNFIFLLGFSQIIIYYSFKLIRWARLVVGLAIIFFTPFLREILYLNKDYNVLIEVFYYFIVSPDPSFSILPYASFCFFASIFSELIYQAKILENKRAIKISIISTLRYGFTFLIAGFALSIVDFNPIITSSFFNPLKYPFLEGRPILRSFSFQFIPYMPEILLRGTSSYILFIMGILIIVLGGNFYLSEISLNKNRIYNYFQFFGENSITLIFIQFIFLPLFLIQVDMFIFFPLFFLYITLLAYLMYIWKKYANYKFNLEWIIEKSTNFEFKNQKSL